jgi:hypothetical protein
MVRKVQDNENENSGKRAAPKKPSARPRRAVATAEPEPVAQPTAGAPASTGAKALIRAGLKALGEVRGDMVARQTRVFELLLGIGQSPAWPTNAGERKRSLADPFGKFEDVFDQRVARSLERLGMPSPQVMQALAEQVALLAETAAEASKPAQSAPSKTRKR